jgi:uncharacterized protein YecE (DUF72 family)
MARAQLGLFGETKTTAPVVPHEDPDARALASKLPSWLRFGTSSWTFEGWSNIVYAGSPSHEALVEHGLGAYAAHPLLRTVGIDRSYYSPIDEADLNAYASQVPRDFLAVAKVWNEITTYAFADHPKNGSRAGEINPHFLDADLAKETFAAYSGGFANHVGAFLFELPPIPRDRLPSDEAFASAIARLLRALPSRFRYAFELRNRELLSPLYFDTLRDHGATHAFNLWTAMPSLAEQFRMPNSITSDIVIARLMLAPTTTYEAMKRAYAPFDRIVLANEDMRRDIVKLTRIASDSNANTMFVLVNNQVEGSSPLTIKALAERIARDRDPPHFMR